MSHHLEPKLFTVFREGYSSKQFLQDLMAGIVVGIVALPLSIALAIASGVKPEQGLYTAIIGGTVAALFSGSRVQVSGPTGAFIVVVYGIVQQYGYEGLAAATFMAGLILLVMGYARMGIFLKFVPYPLTVGFTSGIALIIFSSQVKDFLGLNIENLPANFIEKWIMLFKHINTANLWALGVGAFSLVIIMFWPRVTKKLPGSLVAVTVCSVLVQLFDLPIETIGSRFGSFSTSIPSPKLPLTDPQVMLNLVSPALTIALLAGIESLLSAVVADGMTGTRHRSNMELVSQGAANIISPIFFGIPVTGAIARTATNIKNGAKTPIASIIHALTLALIMFIFGSWASLIPMATLSAILIVVAVQMSERRSFIKMFKNPKSDVAVMLITFLLTVVVDLTVAIETGVVLSSFLFMRRVAEESKFDFITKEFVDDEDEVEDPRAISKKVVPSGVEVFEIYGSLFFAAVDEFRSALQNLKEKPQVLILRMRNVLTIDASGLRALEEVYNNSKLRGTVLLLSGVKSQPLRALRDVGLLETIGPDNICKDIDAALERSRALIRRL